jgi:RNA polymerase sigma-70 factor (ECF subfamily)
MISDWRPVPWKRPFVTRCWKRFHASEPFAMSLTHDRDKADDLVQDAILRAWGNIDRFERGTNLQAWLFTILRNSFYSDYRKRRHEVEDPEGAYVRCLQVPPERGSGLIIEALRMALARLPPEQCEALILVGANGSYEAAAGICGVAVGTIKSRVNRARNQLAVLMVQVAIGMGTGLLTWS